MNKFFKLLGIVAFSAITTFSYAQNDAISNYFGKYVDDERFTVVYVSPKMFKLIAKLDLENQGDPEVAAAIDMMKDITGLRILTTETDVNRFYNEAMAKLKTTKMESLMTVRSKEGENVNFWVADNGGDIINELLLLVGGNEFVMLSIEGNIDLKKVSKLAKALDIKGAEHLKELENAH